jgi:hypothetical protein
MTSLEKAVLVIFGTLFVVWIISIFMLFSTLR